ncbi:efflux RND transporter permease subunit [Chitinophaga sancti]|uniref:efflux RND transporter permease subunit n=1 Tax=Chitinophaga sancti TaxID=1004 RepID=UPI002A758F5C|nr:efflux RND transporter permease subunit [Chitinophaga sancti]WPQ60261.1 efflux RND transporter permease subunit [Chitinophaga sancti]
MKRQRISFIEAAMKYKQVTLVAMGMLLLLGLYALLNMPRSENPKIDMPVAMVYAFYPGADEVQTEKQVTNKIEQFLFSFEEIDKKKTTSQTKDGQVFITVNLHTEVKDRKKFWSTLQHGLNTTLKSNIPSGVIGPVVNSNFGDVTAQIITVSSPIRNYAELEKYMDKIEDGLKVIPEVSKINRSGGQQQQIYVTINDEQLQQYGFDLSTIVRTLQMENVTGYSGEVTVNSNTIPVFTNSQYKTEKDIAEQIIYTTPTGTIVRLKDVATITRRYEEPSSYIRVGNDRVLMLGIEMQPGNNIVQFGHTIEEKLAAIKSKLPDDIQINTIVNQPEVVDESIKHFMREFGLAIGSVILVVMLLLPFRVAAVASVAAPISILITFGLINIMGIELHQVTLAALIIVLGMVVDNAIVVVDNYIEKLDEDITPWTAAWQAAKQLSLPIFTATLAIVFAFAPLAIFMFGIAKDFIAALPVTVAVALITSMAVALLVTPYTCYVFIKQGLKHRMNNRSNKRSLLDRLQETFNKGIEIAFRFPKITVSVAVLALVLALVLAGKVSQEFFPLSESKQFNAEIWMPNGTSLEETEKVVKAVETELKKDSRVVNTASFIGTSSPRFNVTYAPEMPRRNFAQVFINTVSSDATNELVAKYLPIFDKFLPDGYVRLRQLSMQEGSPIAVRIVGEDLNDQKKVAEQVKDILQHAEGTNWVRSDYEDDYLGISLKIKEEDAARLGIPNQAITQTLGAGLKGFAVTQLWEGDKPIDVYLRLDTANRTNFSDLGNLHINKVLLKQVAEIAPSWHTGVIAHKNGLRTLTVLSEAQCGIRASDILKKVQPAIAKLSLPDGVHIEYGGDAESSADNAPGMGLALGTSLLLILLTLLFQFKTFGKTLIILATFPLSLLGAFLGLYITGNPMGMTAFMGIISLIGIVVRNGIILVDYADELVRDHHYSIKAAALATAKRRMRPIFLTSAAAAIGVVPMIAGKSPLWAPLGSVLASGLIVSMVLTLFVIPVLYYLFVRHPNETTGTPDIQYKPAKTALMIIVLICSPFFLHAQSVKLSLEDARKMALEQNRQMKAAQYEIDAAKAAAKSVAANAYPTIDGSVTGVYLGKPIGGALNGLIPDYFGSAMVTASEAIYAGGKIRTGKAAADKGVEIKETQRVLTSSQVLLNVETAYWQVIQVQEKIILANRFRDMLKVLHQDLQNSYDAGLIYKNDLLRVDVNLNEAELNITKAEDGLVLAKLRLAQLTGMAGNTSFIIADSISGDFQTQSLQSNGSDKRPEILLLNQAIEAGQLQKQLLKAESRPTIGVGFSGLATAGKGVNLKDGSDFMGSYFGLASISVPIFDWGKKSGKVKEQTLKLAAQQQQLIDTKELVDLEIQQAYLALNQSSRKVNLSLLSLQQADENLKLANDRFAAGTITGKDVQEAQVIWQQAYSSLIDAKVEYRINEASYKKATGSL